MSDNTEPLKMDELLNELKEANKGLVDARNAESAARSRACDALNRVNKAQKKIDEQMKALRAEASYDTDWKRT